MTQQANQHQPAEILSTEICTPGPGTPLQAKRHLTPAELLHKVCFGSQESSPKLLNFNNVNFFPSPPVKN